MRWAFLGLGVVVMAIALVAIIGAALPVRHHATRKARYRVTPEVLYAVMAGPPDWRSGVKSYGSLPDRDGRRVWWEEDNRGQKITYELVEDIAGKRRTVRIADRDLPYGGTWTYDIAPTSDGGSELRITEDGEIYNVIFRFVSRFFLGYTGSMDGYLGDLGRKFNQPVEIEA